METISFVLKLRTFYISLFVMFSGSVCATMLHVLLRIHCVHCFGRLHHGKTCRIQPKFSCNKLACMVHVAPNGRCWRRTFNKFLQSTRSVMNPTDKNLGMFGVLVRSVFLQQVWKLRYPKDLCDAITHAFMMRFAEWGLQCADLPPLQQTAAAMTFKQNSKSLNLIPQNKQKLVVCSCRAPSFGRKHFCCQLTVLSKPFTNLSRAWMV